ncbi:C4-dicarboxylate transporter DcuC [Vibrio mangrovi]|uniref:C4-dicarboxylate transporter DcuC n=1 Tax=Vibrio mangrovi TaxID=474394 RepID=A0A1Y6ITE9_9VIBR|nr:C4-dicarboxylate transporter DcuC [Vibrio mangrovi]MDW6004624.1 C4-dicarboxylate transporter DcuC [Vibrio mangrovi]SMS00914.1 Putative cryptic C4-dicarboxylate transporter DcuD [Vibrio mangrovi]
MENSLQVPTKLNKTSLMAWIAMIFVVIPGIYFVAGIQAFILAVSLLALTLVGVGIVKKFYAQAIVLVVGCALLIAASYIHPDLAITAKSTGSRFLDVFVEIKSVFSHSMAGLGLTIMVIAGFSRYMTDIGAAGKLVEISVKPIGKIKSKYILLGSCYIFMQLLALFISSPSGLALLMMATLYPILRSLGCSKASVAAVIASGVCIDYGPSATGSVQIAKLTDYDLFSFFITKQIPIVWILFIFIGVMHMIMQAYWDRKEGVDTEDEEGFEVSNDSTNIPKYYAILPVIPMILLFTFSSFSSQWLPESLHFRIDVVSAMLMSFFIAFIIDSVRTLDLHAASNKIAGLFDQMGQSFTTVVSILVCAQVLAAGMIKVGFIDSLFSFIPSGSDTQALLVVVFSGLIFFSSVVLGTGSTFNAFAPVAAEVAKGGGLSVFKLLIPMHFSASLGRSFSPIAGVTIAVAGLVGLTPLEIIKRNAVQLGSAYILMLILSNFLIS